MGALSNRDAVLRPVSAQVAIAEDVNPRSQKRRRLSTSPAFDLRQQQQQKQQQLPPYPSSSSESSRVSAKPSSRSIDSPTRHVSDACRTMDPILLSGMYDFPPDKNDHRPSSPVKYEMPELGPYHGQYWSLMEGSLSDAAVPLTSNGGYVSPYCAPTEPYFGSNLDGDIQLPNDVHQNGMYQSHRNSHGSNGAIIRDANNMYPAQMDNLGWQYSAVDPTLQTQNLQLLDNLSNRIFSTLLTASVQDFSVVATVPETASGQAYATLLSLFDQNKKIFSRDGLFIESQDALHSNSAQYQRVTRKANLATFVACVFGGRNVPFLELDEEFLDLFMPAGTRLLKSEGALFLELKTQAYIYIMMNNSVSREELLDRLFPRDLQLAILRRRPEPACLAPSEQDFIGRLNTRRQYLSAGSDSYEALNQLPQKYNWTEFLEYVRICIRRALESMDAIKVS